MAIIRKLFTRRGSINYVEFVRSTDGLVRIAIVPPNSREYLEIEVPLADVRTIISEISLEEKMEEAGK